MKPLNILVTGVGGFGIGAVTKILATAAQESGLEAIGSETHGLAQRGGVVVSTLRIGSNLLGSPLIIKGTADVIIALEALEALRTKEYLKPGGTIIYNTTTYQPLSVRTGSAEYPSIETIEAELREVTDQVFPVDAGVKAKELGLSQVSNVILIGTLLEKDILPFSAEIVGKAIKQITPPKYYDINMKALRPSS